MANRVAFGVELFYPHTGASSQPRPPPLAFLVVGSSRRSIRTCAAACDVRWLWYVGTLVPVIGLVQVGMQARPTVHVRAAHRPLRGRRVGMRRARGTRRVPQMASPWLRARSSPPSGQARAQVANWSDDVTLWRQALEVLPDNYLAHFSLARVDLRDGNGTRRCAPRAHAGTGAVVRGRSRRHGARVPRATVRRGHRQAPGSAATPSGLLAARFNLGLAYEQRGNSDLAVQQYREAIRRRRGKRRSGRRSLTCSRRRASSMRRWRSRGRRCASIRTRRRRGSCSAAFWRLALPDQAIAELERALASKPAFAPAQSMLATLLLGRGRAARPSNTCARSCERNPSQPGHGPRSGPRSPDTAGSTTRSRNTTKPSASRRVTPNCATRSACASRAGAGFRTPSFSSPKPCGSDRTPTPCR